MGRAPGGGVGGRRSRRSPAWAESITLPRGQTEDGIIADRRHTFPRDVAGAPNNPFIILFEQEDPGQPDDGRFIGEGADNLGTALGLAIQSLQRIGTVQLGAVLGGEHM